MKIKTVPITTLISLIILAFALFSSSVDAQQPSSVPNVLDQNEQERARQAQEEFEERRVEMEERQEQMREEFNSRAQNSAQENRNSSTNDRPSTQDIQQRREQMMQEAEQRRQEQMEKRLEMVQRKFEEKVNQFKQRLLTRIEAFENLINRVDLALANVDLDEQTRTEITGKLNEARTHLDQARADLDSISVPEEFESIDDVRAEAESLRGALLRQVEYLKQAREALVEAIQMVKEVRNNESGTEVAEENQTEIREESQ